MFYQFYRFAAPLDVRWRGSGGTVRIGEDGRKCVVFFGVAGEGPMDAAGVPINISYGGTGFLVVHAEKDGTYVPFIVTCRHVAQLLSRHSQFYIRANTNGGESYTLPVGKMQWAFHPDDTVDLAAVSFVLPKHIFDVIYYRLEPRTTVLGEEGRKRVFCGEAISLIGLFRLHPGKQRDISFVHTGNVAVLPDPTERIPIQDRVTNAQVEAEVYLVEAQTLDGLSGSPAFIHEMIDIEEIELEVPEKGTFHPKAFGSVRLLGLYTGSWDGEPGKLLAEDRDLRRHTYRVPVGVGVVVPADRIVELLGDHPLMKKQRKDYVNSLPDHWAAASQDASIQDPAIGDANPKHREDFNSLLGAAVKKPARED